MLLNEQQISEIFRIFEESNPNPVIELNYTNIFTLLVAVVLSAQTTDIIVNKATAPLFEKYDAPEKMLQLGEVGLKEYVKTINYYNNKAKNIINISKILINKYNNIVPDNLKDLIFLPGVGKKTANVILNVFFGNSTIAVDTHVFRSSQRIGLARGNTPNEIESQLNERIPKQWLKRAGQWLILHGRYICKARIPLCNKCCINSFCLYYKGKKYG